MRVMIALGLLTVVACSSSPPSNGERVAAAIESWWREEERLQPGDEFSEKERACIAANSETVDLDDVERAADGDFAARTPIYVAPYADECLTDAHLLGYFEADNIVSGFVPAEARCLAPVAVEAIRKFGMDAVLADDRPPEVSAHFDAAPC